MPSASEERQLRPRPVREWIAELFDRPFPDICILRCDAGREYGLSFGHAVRCLTLARALATVGVRPVFVCRSLPGAVDFFERSEFQVEVLPDAAPHKGKAVAVETLLSLIETSGVPPENAAVVVDLPYPDLDIESFDLLRREGCRTICIDDARFRVPVCDVYVNGSILALAHVPDAAERQTRAVCKEKSTKLLLGPRYMMLSEDAFTPHVSAPCDGKKPFTVAITFGGADPTGLTQKALKALATMKSACKATIVLGPGLAADKAAAREISALVAAGGKPWRIVRQPENLHAVLAQCDVVICAGGITLYELLARGQSMLPVASTPFEGRVIQAFLDAKLIEHGMHVWDETRFIATLGGIIDNCRSV